MQGRRVEYRPGFPGACGREGVSKVSAQATDRARNGTHSEALQAA
jgi:hypothetical protein